MVIKWSKLNFENAFSCMIISYMVRSRWILDSEAFEYALPSM